MPRPLAAIAPAEPELRGPRWRAELALVLSLCGLLLVPTAGPWPLVLLPLGWSLGQLERARARRAGRRADPSAELGRTIGVVLTVLVAPLLGLAGIVVLFESMW